MFSYTAEHQFRSTVPEVNNSTSDQPPPLMDDSTPPQDTLESVLLDRPDFIFPNISAKLKDLAYETKDFEKAVEQLINQSNRTLVLNTMLNTANIKLKKKIKQMKIEHGYQTADLIFNKELLQYTEISKATLHSELTVVHKQLKITRDKLANASSKIQAMKAEISQLKSELTPWE